MNDLLKQVKELQKDKPKRFVTRIHVFYEGAVTEVDVYELFHKELEKNNIHQKVLSVVNISRALESTNSLKNLLNMFDRSDNFVYYNNENLKTRVEKNEYVIFIHDFDVYHDYSDGTSTENFERVEYAKSHFDNDLKRVYSKFNNKQIKFLVLASFPSIEYAICLGTLNQNELKQLAITTAEDAIDVMSINTGLILSRKTKHFTDVFESNNYSHDLMMENASIDRNNKVLDENVITFNNSLLEYGISKYVVDKKRTFTYIDGIIDVIVKVFKSGYNN